MTVTLPAGNPSSEVPGRAPLRGRPFPIWPVYGLILPAFVAIWSGWVGLGQMAGFGPVKLLPGISDYELNTAITLPIGMETYAAFALGAWLSGRVPARAQTFARRSVIWSLAVGAGGQVVYHLLAAAHATRAPWWVTMVVACLPVAVLGMGAALAHLIREDGTVSRETSPVELVSRETSALTYATAQDVAESEAAFRGEDLARSVVDEAEALLTEAVPLSPAPASGRPWSSAELVQAAEALSAEEPELTKLEVAARLGVSDRRVRQARKAVES